MKQFKYLLFITLGVMLFNACEEDTFISDIENGENLVVFSSPTKGVNNIANGDEYQVPVQMKVEGPSVAELSGDITATVEVDYSGIPDTLDFRAREGVHFSMPDKTITLSESNNYLGVIDFTMLTSGITAPITYTETNEDTGELDTLSYSPKFKLKVTEASGGGNVIASGKPLEVTLNYACSSNLQGTYSMTITRDDGLTATNPSEEVTKTGVGQYVTQSVEYFFPAGPRGAYLTSGVQFSDVCGTLTVPAHILGETYSNEVAGTQEGSVDGNSQTGDLTSFTLHYSVDGLGSFTAVYTKLP